MVDDSRISRAGGGGGGAFDLGPATNTFTGATRAIAEAARDTYAAANADWLALYNGDRNFRIALMESTDGPAYDFQRRNAAGNGWENITGLVRGRQGAAGVDGTPGGGAIEDTGIVLDLTGVVITPNQFRSTGLILGERGDTSAVLYQVEADTLALLWFFTSDLYDVATASAGDAIDLSDASRNALILPESAGSSLSGVVYGSLTSSNELLVAFSQDDSDTHLRFWRYIPSAAQGLDQAAVDARIAPYARAAPSGTIADAQIPDSIMRDAELTAATVRNLLSLTATEVNNLFVGATIAGQVVTFTQNDGSTETITVPAGTGGMADGVVASGVFNAAATELVLTLDTGGTVTIDVPAALRGSGGTTSLERTGAMPQALSGAIDWDALDTVGFYTVATGASQTNGPAGATLGAAHIFTSRTYAVQIAWTFETSARTFTRTRPGASGTPWGSWERIHIPIDSIVELLEARTGDDRLNANALRLLAAQIDAELGVATWRTGGGVTETRSNELIQAALAAAVIGNTETNITVTHNADGTLDFAVIYPNQVSEAEAQAGTGLIARLWTPQRVAQAITALAPGGTTTGLNQTQVDARVQAGLMAAVTGNTETGIDVVYNPDGTFDFVVGAPAAHTRYSAIRDGDNGFNVGSFTNAATGTSSDSDEITIATWTSGERHLAFAQPVSLAEYTDMREQGSPFNARASFTIHGVHLTIDNEEHRIYIFDSTLLLSASGDVWELS